MTLRFYQVFFTILICLNSIAALAKDTADATARDSGAGHEISYRTIPNAEDQLRSFLKWVLQEHGQREGTFYFPHLKLKPHCSSPLAKHSEKSSDAKWKRFQDGTIVLNNECLDNPLILWSEGNMLFPPVFIGDDIHTVLNAKQAGSYMALSLLPKDYIDLFKDVVPTENDISGSTYLVDREWAFQKIRDALNGDKIIVHR